MTLVDTVSLRPGYDISRIICGGWQLAGGHGPINRAVAVADLDAFCEAGISTFDCADIYTGVEELIGAFRAEYGRRHGAEALGRIKVHTKCVPDLARLHDVDRTYIRAVVDTSLKRLRAERLDLVQFHWWDYDVPGYIEAAGWLSEMQREGKIDRIGGTNFDTPRSAELVAAGVDLVSLQVQYSLIDNRPEHGLVDFCRRNRRPPPLLRHGCRRLPLRPLARRAGAAAAFREPIAHQVQAGDRRFRRLGPVPGTAWRPAPGRRSPRHRYRFGGESRHARPG